MRRGPTLERDAQPLPLPRWRTRRADGGLADGSCADASRPPVDAGPPPPPCNEITFRYVNPSVTLALRIYLVLGSR
ncbi:MAG TPA: hypothetical protein VIL20_24015 [Sandaracinaceae bacterium]